MSGSYERLGGGWSTRERVVACVGVVATAALGGLALLRLPGGAGAPAPALLYKIALSVREGEAHAVHDLVNDTFAHVDPNFDLGCDGVKINGYLMSYGPQVHWVEASILSNDPQPIKYWQDYFEELNGDLSSWNAFMHNKVSMFTSNVTAPYLRMVENKIPLMLRTSDGYSGKASPTGELAHVLFQVAGRMYEIAGPVTAEYVTTYDGYVAAANTAMQKWAADKGYYPPMLSGVSVSAEHGASETLDDDDLVDDLQSIADVHSYAELEMDACAITRIETVSAKGFRSPVRYVANALANDALATTDPATGEKTGLTVEDYNSYIWKTHAEIAGSYDNWAGWDHWMDQHIGLKYVGSDSCAVSHQLNANLTARGVAVGQRTTADYGAEKAIHWYTGYAGSMTWEYWVTGCPSYSTDSEADVCACHASNNDKIFLEETGANCAAARTGSSTTAPRFPRPSF
ncbi:hypothetical protein JL720_12800 [Aureococcus anophagefferens]|nr:hypothetical protein JL720_12800 [Aureococcus anophagefferens]